MLGALRVMRPPPAAAWSPLDLSGLAAWWDASDTATITESGGAVSQWNDKSGNGFHLTASGTGQPTTGSRTVNGRNTLDFDGTTDSMTTAGAPLSTQPYTIFAVYQADSTAYQRFVNIAGTAFGCNADLGHGGKLVVLYANNLGTATAAASTSLTQASWIFNDTASKIWTDGVLDSTVVAGTNSPTGVVTVSKTPDFYNGALCELFLVDGAVDTTDREAAEDYLSAKWGTP